MASDVPDDLKKNEIQTQEIATPDWSTLHMGVVELKVRNLELQIAFYKDIIGLEVHSQTKEQCLLGSNSIPILRLLHDKKSLPTFQRNSAGLYHFAIVFKSRPVLAQTVDRLIQLYAHKFQGTADHSVSEAFYFSDPENNGLELYFDRDPITWKWQNGRVQMDSTFIDPQAYIQAHKDGQGSDSKKIGHIHLQVGDIDKARDFYVNTLGLTVTAEFPSALFVSEGRYHHQVGLNTWHSKGAGNRWESLGLQSFQMLISNPLTYNILRQRLERLEIPFHEKSGIHLYVNDPWDNSVMITLERGNIWEKFIHH